MVAEVNGSPVTLKEMKREIDSLRGVPSSLQGRSATQAEVSEALDRLISRAVVLKEGERIGVTVSATEIEDEIRRYRADFPPGGLEKSLVQKGIGVDEWREDLRRSLLYRKSAEAISASLASVSGKEVEAALKKQPVQAARPERIRVMQLLFDTKEAAVSARESLLAGKDAEQVLKGFAGTDAHPADVDLGLLAKEDLPEDLAPELFSLREGGVSQVTKGEQSYSLFVVVKKEAARAVPPAAAYAEVEANLLRARREEAFRRWLTEARGKADIRVQTTLLSRLVEGGK